MQKDLLNNLKKIQADNSTYGIQKKTEVLTALSAIKFTNVRNIQLYHQHLLFLLAYPNTNELNKLVIKETLRLTELILKLPAHKKELLTQSGIAYTETHGSFSFTITKWLAITFDNQISIHSFDEKGVHPKELLKHVLLESEFELVTNDKLGKLQWLQTASNIKNKATLLKWLLNAVNSINVEDKLKEQLFESLQLYIRIKPSVLSFSKTFGKLALEKTYFHQTELLKKFNEAQIINTKLPPETTLNEQQKQSILSTARISLLLLNRETDPITYACTQNLKYYQLQRGLSIALFCMQAPYRLPFESYVGFMMFKNGYPMAYGGAWPFVSRSLLGINIFEAYRGGESAFVFAQLLRTYKQVFNIKQFEVEPYQFGKNNAEGLKSGAFWFYYRFGFKPLNENLKTLAEQEYQKIINTKGYRTPINTLKEFTKSNLALNFKPLKTTIKPSTISQFISFKINVVFKGDREKANVWCNNLVKEKLKLNTTKLSKNETISFKKLSSFIAFCLNIDEMNAEIKKTLVKLILEKGNSEFSYIIQVNQFPFQKYFKKELITFKT